MNETHYIWINPVAAQLHPPEALAQLLARHGCVQVSCREDWGGIVREKYRALVRERTDVAADARCPMAAQLVRRCLADRADSSLTVAGIEPILLHAARELAGRADLRDRPKLITTPCRALADLGSALELPDTRFVPWSRLLEQWGEQLPVNRLEASPIPPGFFDGCSFPVVRLSGREAIAAYADSGPYGTERLAELLYCPGGCHRGDGVPCRE